VQAYRGFESLPLRQIPKPGFAPGFLFVALAMYVRLIESFEKLAKFSSHPILFAKKIYNVRAADVSFHPRELQGNDVPIRSTSPIASHLPGWPLFQGNKACRRQQQRLLTTGLLPSIY
jgi:hypothetical protein